ncbi:heparan-alpha-glucosaminide N-acetyltransferase [Cephus cinctus]|uniref:Heparan-alpha-glucosaminide N-acetyltransferase n=1 Tax=Cephus cinctus TaxID=211228 RepID=A0AAJ7FSU4_CEPCN|nr:heparan-alpha-glucosaminide N-acetyltransferase [Cephus cinctus]
MDTNTCTYDELRYDRACVGLRSNFETAETFLYSLSSDCESCPYGRIASISKSNNQSVRFDTTYKSFWRVIETDGESEYISASDKSGIVCELSPNVGQFGLYELTVNNGSCDFTTIQEPSNLYTSLVVVLGALLCISFGSSLLRTGVVALVKRFRRDNTEPPPDKTSTKRRINSIDTFRGISILFMIFVNDGAGGYAILEHVTWNGLFVGDFVFPCFVWVMGVCIPISLSSQLSHGVSRLSLCCAILKRSVLLFLIGLSLNTLGTDAQLENIRILGVLQRFSIVYLVVALTFALLNRRKPLELENLFLRRISEILALLPQWLIILAILAAHCVITFHLPVPNCPTGYLGPGGRHEDGKYFNCTGGATGYIDKIVLGIDHIYQWPTSSTVYGSGPFDPEGILGCLTTIFQAFLGVQAGMILRYYKNWKDRVARWLLWAAICGTLGAILHFNDFIPANKNLWSLSFVLLTTCFAFLLLTGCYVLIDVTEVWRGGPFRIPGMNALAMYFGHQLCYQIFPFHWRYGLMNTHFSLLIEAVWGAALWTLVAYILHHKRIYITL